jgi:hypothetical protein
VSPSITLNAFRSALISRSTGPLFQYGLRWPGCELKSWSPLHANSMVLFCEGLGAVMNVPLSLRSAPRLNWNQ